jgi:hypothetical protein
MFLSFQEAECPAGIVVTPRARFPAARLPNPETRRKALIDSRKAVASPRPSPCPEFALPGDRRAPAVQAHRTLGRALQRNVPGGLGRTGLGNGGRGLSARPLRTNLKTGISTPAPRLLGSVLARSQSTRNPCCDRPPPTATNQPDGGDQRQTQNS